MTLRAAIGRLPSNRASPLRRLRGRGAATRRSWKNGAVTAAEASTDPTSANSDGHAQETPCSQPGASDAPSSQVLSARRSYELGELGEGSLAGDWLSQLRRWYDEAAADERIIDPSAMQLATADAAGHPDVRSVLAKGFDRTGVVFFTNYDSAKGRQLAANPVAAAIFAWLPLERQVRFRGPVSRVSRDETARYFATRPRGAQLAAWASPQSEPIADRRRLEELLEQVTERFGDADIPPPPGWGGYRIAVTEMEFWQGRQFRLHDRLRFFRAPGGDWTVERLAP